MAITTHHVKDKLPRSGQWVCARYTGGNWGVSEDLLYWVVAKFVTGISIAEREALPDGDRKRTYKGGDEAWNNTRPYEWDTHGALSIFGQEVDYWFELPVLEWGPGDEPRHPNLPGREKFFGSHGDTV